MTKYAVIHRTFGLIDVVDERSTNDLNYTYMLIPKEQEEVIENQARENREKWPKLARMIKQV